MRAATILDAGIDSAKTNDGRFRIEDINLYHEGYAEPGYENPEGGVIAVGNWNNITRYDKEQGKYVVEDDTPSRVARLLERIGVDLQWSDEWDTCDECGKLVRTQPDSYGWTKSYVIQNDCEIICLKCIDPVEHLEALEGEDNRANTIDHIKPEEHGYKKVNGTFESGLHSGQTDDPQEIASVLREKGVKRFLFNVDSVGQFDVHFDLYVHESEHSEDLLSAPVFS